MKKYLSKILGLTTILTGVAVMLIPQIAQAGTGLFGLDGPTDIILNTIIGNIGNLVLQFAAWAVTISGLFLSWSVNLTLNIKDIANTGAIEAAWVVVRDLSSMFIIFMLLYSAIVMILDIEGPKFGQLVKNIFIAGMLINFSLFFVRVAVDASNLVSLQFYNAIVPAQNANSGNFNNVRSVYDGGLSDVFMQSLQLPRIYDNKSFLKGSEIGFSLILGTFGGAILMIMAALSFLGAALAFSIRTGLLVFIMALSPLFFAGMIFPQIKKDVSEPLLGLLKGQLIFMPVYLGLMYVGLRVISDEKFLQIFQGIVTSGNDQKLGLTLASLVIQYTIAAIFINAPLLAAIKFGAIGASWVPTGKGATGLFGDAGRMVGGFLGRNTAGVAGKALGESFDKMAANGTFMGSSALAKYGGKVARFTRVSQSIRGGLETAEKGKYGGARSLADIDKENKERTKEVSGVARAGAQLNAINSYINAKAPTDAQRTTFHETISKMSKKDIEGTEIETLSNPQFITRLSTKQFEALMETDSITQNQKDDLKAKRKAELEKTLGSGELKDIEHIMKGITGKELSGVSKVLTNNDVKDFLKPEQLKEMEDNIDRTTKKAIHDYIVYLPPANTHKSFSYMTDPKISARWDK